MGKQNIFLFIALIGLVTGAFAYINSTYASKEIVNIILDHVIRIEMKVDILSLERAQR